MFAHSLPPIDPYVSVTQNVWVHLGFPLNTSFIWMAVHWSRAGHEDVINWIGTFAIMARGCHAQGTGECNHRCGKWFPESVWLEDLNPSPWSVSLGSTATNQTSFALWMSSLRTLPELLKISGNRVGKLKPKFQYETGLWSVVTISVSPEEISTLLSWVFTQPTIQSSSIKTKTALTPGLGESRRRKTSHGLFHRRLMEAVCATICLSITMNE